MFKTDLSHTFGEHAVSPQERERRVRDMFQRIAPRYDVMNDFMSFGIHRLWKRTLAWAVNPKSGQRILDLAGGTGDVASLIGGPDREVVVCDPSLGMMTVGKLGRARYLRWLAGAAEALPLADASADTVTMAFGIRNVTHMDQALAEIVRILKPGGRFLCLEFSTPRASIRPFYNAFSRTVIPRLGAWVARDPAAYTYLVESIQRFPNQDAFKAILEEAGLIDVYYRNVSLGIACLHVGTKPSYAD